MTANHLGLPARLARGAGAVVVCACLSGSLAAVESQHGTAVEARLSTPISTYSAKPGMQIAAAVTTSLCAGGASVLPQGTELLGVVSRVRKVGLGLVYESAGLKLEFTRLELPDGRQYPVTARLTEIDNARERVDREGNIHGTRATATLSNRVGERILVAALVHPAIMIPLFVLETSVFHFPDPEIQFGRGAAIRLNVEFPEEFGALAPCPLPERETSPEESAEVEKVVDALPYWTYSLRQRQPMDLVNLLFVGPREDLDRTFAAAGWIGARANSMRATVAVIRAIAEDRGFSDAPMRTLLLDGREPDLRLQKGLDTFEKRDHLRIWKRDDELDGRPMWASAATRDVAATFGMHPFGFTHQVQSDVDLERDQVVHDLVFTGCVDSVAYVPRPEGVRETGEDYRKGVNTDARVAVVVLNGCTQPIEDFSTDEPMPKPAGLVRVIRRATLTARNHFVRDNLVYRAADYLRLSYLTFRQLDQQAREEGRARQLEAAMRGAPPAKPQ
jgi:hypothetical protein